MARGLAFASLLLLLSATASAQTTCIAELAHCRTLLFVAEDVVGADECFETHLTIPPPCDQDAKAFRAVTRILRFPQDPSDPVGLNNSWQEILDLAHVVVMGRPGFARSTPGPLAGIVEARESTGREALHAEPAGRVLFQEVTRLDISSSAIRSLLAQGGDPRFLVPEAVRAILLQSGCYRSDSTHDRPGAAGPSPRLFKEDRARAK